MTEHKGRITYFQVDDRWVFEIVGGNGEVQARSERYDSKSNAERGLKDLYATMQSIEPS